MLVPLACGGSDDSSASEGGTGPDPASDSGSGSGSGSEGGPGDPDTGTAGDADGSRGDTTAPGETTEAPGDTTASADDTTGPSVRDCDPGLEPSGFTEVRGCEAPVGEPFCSEGAEHVANGSDIPWQSNPPHSGPHYPMWQTWGEHEQSVARGNWVHNLEHGGIVLAYLCPGGCDAELDVLREVIAARPDLRILMTADAQLPGPRFAAISWTWVHRFDTPDLDELLCFVDQHENHAPEDVP